MRWCPEGGNWVPGRGGGVSWGRHMEWRWVAVDSKSVAPLLWRRAPPVCRLEWLQCRAGPATGLSACLARPCPSGVSVTDRNLQQLGLISLHGRFVGFDGKQRQAEEVLRMILKDLEQSLSKVTKYPFIYNLSDEHEEYCWS